MGKKKGKEKEENKPKKVAVDKTFGMKNKKGAAAQKQINARGLANHQKQDQKMKEKSAADKKKLKEAKEAEAKFLASFGYKAPAKKKAPPKPQNEDGGDGEEGDENEPTFGQPGFVYADGSVEPDLSILAEAEAERDEDEIVVRSLEELIEVAREELIQNAKRDGIELTPVNETSFKAWKKRKIQEKKAALKKEKARTKANLKDGVQTGATGKDMFQTGYVKGADVKVEVDDDDSDDGGDIDISALRAEEAASAEGEVIDEKAAAADQAAVEVDTSLFAMLDEEDLSDLDSDDEETGEDQMEKLLKQAEERKAAEVAKKIEETKKQAEIAATAREKELAAKREAEAQAAKEKAEKEAKEKEEREAAALKVIEEEKARRAAIEAKKAADPTIGMTVRDQIAAGLLVEANPGEATLFAKKLTKEEKKAQMAAKRAAIKAKKEAAKAAEAASAGQ